ncbi:MAG: c-type cytochrome [Deltaproteobacteria bacterium]|nr:c-type cytochrome [Deltaproteobacteria bacterium]
MNSVIEMSSNLKVVIFSVCVVLLYTAYVELHVPRIEPSPPPVINMPGSNTTEDLREDLMTLGKRIYHGRGACALCHDGSGGRAPSLKDIFNVAALRINDSAYRGSAKDARAYIRESMLRPSVYVVEGFALKGEPSPMKSVTLPPAELTEREVRAVVDYIEGVSLRGSAR